MVMAGLIIKSVFLIVLMLGVDHAGSSSSPAIKAAYWPSWDSNFTAMAIDTSHFTHVHYAFLLPDNITYSLVVSSTEGLLLSNFTSTLLHNKDHKVKTMLSLGGAGGDSSAIFARMASNVSSRQIFISSTIEIARKYGFDGLDLDWEYPATPKEMYDLGQLLNEWRVALKQEANITCQSPLLLSAATYFSPEFFLDKIFRSYPVDSMKKNLDWVNAMFYDYHGGWDTSTTGAHAALFDINSKLSTSYGLQSWIKSGLPRNMLVMGLPLYGRTWQLENHQNHGVGAPAIAIGPGDLGQLTFSQVVDFNKQQNARVVFDAATVSTYSYAGDIWIGYDGPLSTTLKIGYARAHGLRGYFFWAVNGDKKWQISKQGKVFIGDPF
ncbi:Class v chitinase chit5 [Thalictrum thalictroides]|uniref:Class v chitinase chit5 n=1 Tax=Thalictrum thalictroides TaxID=46969 RepID=A0A7J6W593_THATH|nr:Class v chitinase chit5 [Thalictrum thalictroides]